MIRFSMLCILFCWSNTISSQHAYWTKESPYEVSWKKDLIISGISAGTFFTGMSLERNEPIVEFTMGSFTQADIDRINGFDRGYAGNWNVNAKDNGKIFKFTAKTIVPIGLLAMPGNIKSRATLGLLFYQGFYLNAGLIGLSKGTTNRYRPYTYLTLDEISRLTGEAEEEFLEDIEGDDIEDSFYSGDAAATAYGLMFFAKIFNDYYPDSKYKYVIWGTAGVGTALGAYFRAKSGKHFPSDVIVGSLIGGGIGILIPHLHKRRDDGKISLYPSQNGLSLVYKMK